MQTQKETSVSAKRSLSDEPWLFLAGPVFLLCTITIAVWLHQQELLYWLLASLIGMALCVHYKIRGCVYTMIVLAVFAFVRHGWFIDQHLWNLGLEGSLACGFVITALAADQRFSLLQSIHNLSEAQGATIGHLEQNVAMLMGASQAQQISLQEKIEEKQKELEDVQSELSSILILNEVLRKNSASQLQESVQMAEILLDRDRRIGYLLAEREELSQTLEHLRDESRLTQENEQLLHELNASRVDLEQIRCMSETIAHLTEQLAENGQPVSKLKAENERLLGELKAKQQDEARMQSMNETIGHLTQKLASQEESASNRFRALTIEKQKLQELLDVAKINTQNLEERVQKLSVELAQSLLSVQALEFVQAERKILQDNLQAAELERQQLLQESQQHLQQIQTLNESLADLTQQLAGQRDPSSIAFYALKAEKQTVIEELKGVKSENQMLQNRLQQLSEELGHSLTSLQKLEQLQTEKNFLQDRLRVAELELSTLTKKSEVTFSPTLPQELPPSLLSLKKWEDLQTEKNFFQERLQQAEIELSRLVQKTESQPFSSSAPIKPALHAEREILLAKLSETQSHLSLLEERLKKSSQVETLYEQLKAQFEEKNAVLHETRAQLFRTDTELQKLQIEKEQQVLEVDPFSTEIGQEIAALEQEISELHLENEQLQQIISDLLKKE
jgi:hypothetical protein